MAKNETLQVCIHRGRHRLMSDKGKLLEEANRFLWALDTRGLSPRTIRAYAFDLLVLYRWMSEGGHCLERLTQSTLLDFVAHEQARGAHPSSINRRLTVCRLLHHFHYPNGLKSAAGTSLPAPYYRGPGRERHLGVHRLHKKRELVLRVKIPDKQICPLSGEQIREYLRSLRRYRDIAIVHLMLLSGLRSREVLQLGCSDICLIERRVRVKGKGNKERIVPLADLSVLSLEQYLTYERLRGYDDETLFVCLQGKRRGHAMTPAGLRSIFRTRRKNSAVQDANPHRFRHTFGADMARRGVHLYVLQKLMGHANPEMTLRYINLSMEDIADAYYAAAKEIQKHYDLE
jgi:site-specific recombinase XerD